MSIQSNSYPLIYFSFFTCSLVFSFLINGIFLKFARTLGIRNTDSETIIRWSTQSKPALGGLTFYITFLLAITCYSIFFDPNQFFLSKQFVGFLLACTLAFLVGLADDAYDTRPFLKFIAQLSCGIILIVSGIEIHLSSYYLINYLITLFWVVGIMNSVNMLDNMDAITSVVAINIILSAMVLIYFQYNYQNNIHFIVLIGILAALSGFLFFNWHPSKMFMGDTGSQFLGIFLAAIGIIYFWNAQGTTMHVFSNSDSTEVILYPRSGLRTIIIPILVFIMPITDTSIVVINRLMKGHSPFIGGKDHTTHCLAHLGFSDRQVALIISGVSFISVVLLIVIFKLIKYWSDLHSFIFISYVALVFAAFFSITKIKPPATSNT